MRDELARELKAIAFIFAAAIAVMKIAYYKESLIEVIRTTAALFWLFVIPGYTIMLHWKQHLGLIERLFAGTVAAIAINSIASYYLGIAGLRIQNQTILLPAAVIAASLAWQKFSGRKSPQQQSQQGPEQPKA